ncbi:MAG: hypothetical protein EOM50_04115 [Erysipelotrichia bacterium]|nr:hypothetical protein [Erysipelotrichia bacterium]
MKHIFVTYGDMGYETAKTKIVAQAERTGEFQEIRSCGREDLSRELLASKVIKEKRGGGLWSWKPDIILSTIENHEDGDIIVYCDAGCSVYPSSEWKKIWKKLETHDIIAQRIFQRTENWTRKEIIDYFQNNGFTWLKCFQYQATVVVVVSEFSRNFIREWRDLMITHPEFAMDVTPEERPLQHASLIENRHDQAIYSALVYKYLANPETRNKIYTQWEHLENYDPIFKQAIRATRLRHGEEESRYHKQSALIKRLIKDYIFKPFYYAPLQWWYSR